MSSHFLPTLFIASVWLAGLLNAQESKQPKGIVVLEGEKLPVLKKSGSAQSQSLQAYGVGAWSGDAHLWWTGAKPGDVLELGFTIPTAGKYQIGAGLTKAIDYGIFQVEFDGTKLGDPIDFYNDGVVHTGTISLGGAVTLAGGEHRLSFKITGANSKALPGYMLGLDYVVIAPEGAGDVTKLGPSLKAAKPPVARGKKPVDELKVGNALDAKPLTPDQQRAAFKVADGFEIELVASEETGLPKPSMVAFDSAGRLWSATATEYPRDQDPTIWTKPGKDKIVIIDHPCARTPQTARVWAEGMVMPLSILPSGKGAFVAQGPEILYMEDKNGDGKADSREVRLKGFGVQDTHTLPHQLTRMPGGRIVYSQGVLNNGKVTDAAGHTIDFNKTQIATFKPDGTAHDVIGAGLNNIWAWAVSREGRVFIHEANDFGYSLVPFEEDSTYPSFIQTKLHPAAPMHPPTAQGLELGGTGFSGLAICDDLQGSFPAPWHSLIYVANPILGKIQAVSMEVAANGVYSFKKAGDLVSCSDSMFRPVAITFGPDDCLYITDWYNRIISHNEVARDHPGRDKTRGRIWRVRHKSQAERTIPDLASMVATELPKHLSASSTWEMRAAWQEIALRGTKELIPALSSLLQNPQTTDDVKIHALWAVEDLGHFDAGLWKQLLASINSNVRREAIRALSSLKVKPAEGFSLLQPLSGETSWTVRYEMLRYFRRVGASAEHLAWLHKWSEGPADQTKVNGWNGPFLALGGAYERAFQDFLFLLITDKTKHSPASDPRWDETLETNPARAAAETAEVAKKTGEIKTLLSKQPQRPLEAGRSLVETTCLMCHRIGEKGIALAPPLDGSASRDTDALITSILDPDAAVENVFRLYRVHLLDGNQVMGFRKSIDDKEITMMFMGGGTQTIPLNKIKSAGYIQGQSVMPALGAGFTVDQVADIVAYLKTVK